MKFLGHQFSSKSSQYQNPQEPEHLRTLSRRYWQGMLSFSIVVVLASIGFGVINFINVLEALRANAKPVMTLHLPFDRSKLRSLISSFDARAVQFQTLKNAPLSVEDPSK